MTVYYAFFEGGGGANGNRTGTVQEVFSDPNIFLGTPMPLADCYTAEFLSWTVPCPEGTVVGSTFDGATWANPTPPETEQ